MASTFTEYIPRPKGTYQWIFKILGVGTISWSCIGHILSISTIILVHLLNNGLNKFSIFFRTNLELCWSDMSSVEGRGTT